MLGVSPWVWMLAPGLWFARVIISAFLVDRITRTVVEKADVKDLPEVLSGLGVLAAVLSAPIRPAPQAAVSAAAVGVADGAAVREGGSAR